MKLSTNRILTTQTGSMPRPHELWELLVAKEKGQSVDEARMKVLVKQGVAETLKNLSNAGMDVINDGEMGRASYAMYIQHRLTGLTGPENPQPLGRGGDAGDFPEWAARRPNVGGGTLRRPACVAPVEPGDMSQVHTDIANLKDGAKGLKYEELFMTSVSPASVVNNHQNQYYPTKEAYMYAVADAMKAEYKAVVDSGLLLQIDCVDLGGRYEGNMTLQDVRKDRALKIELINHATKGLPADKIRLHVCWGAAETPHHKDVPLKDMADILINAHPQALVVVGANGRHEHEWKVWKDTKLPAGKIVIPGVIDNTTNIIEHPETVAERLVTYAGVVGRENVMGGVDCGFFPNIFALERVDAKIVLVKLKSQTEGAALASKELWKK